MEPALVLSLASGLALCSLLAADLAIQAIRGVVAATLHWPMSFARRAACITTVAVLGLMARPVSSGAVTPPPQARIVLPTAGAEAPAEPPDALLEGHQALDPGIGGTHVVERGDCLWRIARSVLEQAGAAADGPAISDLWRSIYEMNREVIGPDPDLIHPGQVLAIPEV